MAYPLTTYCHVTDYLGSVRTTYRVTGESDAVPVQHISYMPSGAVIRDSQSGLHKRKFTGKEQITMHGWNMYDSGARFQYRVMPRFSSIDPLCEKYYNTSPYAYCINNPVRFIDPDGKAPGDFFKKKDDAAKDFGIFYNDNSIRENKEYSSFIFRIKDSEGNIGYTYATANIGTSASVSLISEPGAENIATIHTHAAYDKRFGLGNDTFSGIYNHNGELIQNNSDRQKVGTGVDIGNANARKMDSYVVTPNGSLQKYDPSTGRISQISNKMPSDPNHPDRLNNIGIEEKNRFSVTTELKIKINIGIGILNNILK